MNTKTILPTWELYNSKLRCKIEENKIEDFLQWDFIKESMFHEVHSDKYEFLKKHKQYDDFKSGILENDFGNPNRYYLDNSTSGNLLHHMYSYLRFCDSTGYKIKTNSGSVFEFGGGYGSFCRMLYNLGFSGDYTIYDTEDFNTLQLHYLTKVLSGVCISKDPSELVPKENYVKLINKIEYESIKCNLFVALWSISEAPIELRDTILKTVQPDYYLIAYQSGFDGVDNELYFNNFIKSKPDFDFNKESIFDFPHSKYLFGKRK